MKFLVLILSFCVFAFGEFSVKSISELKEANFVRQNFEESCGAASLANVLNFFSFRRFDERVILEILEQKTDMLSFNELQETAKKLGFESQSFLLLRGHFEALKVPILVKIEKDPRFPHFVVVLNLQSDFVQVLDQNFGTYTASKAEFYSIWDKDKKGGYALIILPKDFKDFKVNNPHFFEPYFLDKTRLKF